MSFEDLIFREFIAAYYGLGLAGFILLVRRHMRQI